MPTFYAEDIDIDADEFISSCSSDEVQELIDILVEEGYVNRKDVVSTQKNLLDEEWDEVIGKLKGNGRLHLTNEEEEIIKKIANRL